MQVQFDFRFPRQTLRALFFSGAVQPAEFEVQCAPEFMVNFYL